MDRRRDKRNTGLLWGAAALLVPLCLLVCVFCLPPQYEETFLGELSYKRELLLETPPEGYGRIITVGGSAAAFGQRSDLLEEALEGYTVLNMGMYAGLGSTVTMELTLPLVREGDIVIFSPEQNRETLSVHLNPRALWQAADGHPELLAAAGFTGLPAMIADLPEFAGEKFGFFLKSAPTGEGVYARSSFNDRGDIDYPGRGENVMAAGYDPNMMISADIGSYSEELIDYINRCAAYCAQRGAKLYYRFCPMNEAALENGDPAELRACEEALQSRLSCPILGSMERMVLPAGRFYDTNFHLNSTGAVLNTALLLADLEEAGLLQAAGTIEVPPMPEGQGLATVEGDSADEACFTYEEGPAGCTVTGLTAEGRQRSVLTVPAAHAGHPVIAVAPEAFRGNEVLRELTILENITNLSDGVFEGCTALERLVVNNAHPSAVTVGEGLLRGTDCRVIVPRESLSNYLTNYFWSIHAGRIRGEELQTAEDRTEGAAGTLSGSGAEGPRAVSAEEYADPVRDEGRNDGFRSEKADNNEGESRIDADEPGAMSIRYMGNGGRDASGAEGRTVSCGSAHLRVPTEQNFFMRPGFAAIGWNTAPDGTGTRMGFGSRTERREGLTLYAEWVPENPAGDFLYELQGSVARITGYRGAGVRCTVPEYLEGARVRSISAGAFSGADFTVLVLPPSLRTVEDGAFTGCGNLREIFCFDGIRSISDGAFTGCGGLQTLHINAVTDPVYSVSYFASFAEKYDRLLTLRGQKKLVLFAGSSTRYGYDSAALAEAFPGYEPVNMGVYAYTNALPQLELIRSCMEEGDVLLHGPEFDVLHHQFCCETALDQSFWAMMEADYDTAAGLDLRDYTAVFDALGAYLQGRVQMTARSSKDSPEHYDDDGNYYPVATYNEYGDFSLPRAGGAEEQLLQYMRADYTVLAFTQERIDALNGEYHRFLQDGITVLFTYSPRNRASLTPESTPEARAALHELLCGSLIVPVITDIESRLYPTSLFYIIDSHLSSEGAELHTAEIIDTLRPYLEQ